MESERQRYRTSIILFSICTAITLGLAIFGIVIDNPAGIGVSVMASIMNIYHLCYNIKQWRKSL